MELKADGQQNIEPVTKPNDDNAVLICIRNRPTSDREVDGFTQRGWQMIYSLGTQSAVLTSTKSSTSATITDDLIGLKISSRYAQSALLIRFSASGEQTDTGSERSAKFQVYVDGQATYGTGDSTGVSGFANVQFNAALIAVVPVRAGTHSVDVKWAGTALGLQIDPSSGYSHCSLTVEEVFCEDVNILSDMEGFAAMNYASRNLPRVSFKALKTDIAAIDQELTICSKMFYVTGENSALQIEATASLALTDTSSPMRIYVDGTFQCGSSPNANNGFITAQGISAIVPVAPGNHLVELRWRGISQTLECGTHPEYTHANLLIREVVQ